LNLDGFKRVGLGYERPGFGGRHWRIWRERGGYRFQLEALTPEFQGECVDNGNEDLLGAFAPLVDEFAPRLERAIELARIWDQQFQTNPGRAAAGCRT